MFKFKQSNAFTLVELLVAVSILVMVLGAAVSVEVSNLKLASRDEHYLQATNLAQEQLNLIKTVRDNNPAADPFAGFPTLTAPNIIKQLNKNATTNKWELSNGEKPYPIDGVNYKVQIRVFQDPPNLP